MPQPPGVPSMNRGVIYETTDQTLLKRDISEVIDLLSPFDTPVLDMVGKDSLKFPCSQVKHEWIYDQLSPRSGTLAATYVAGSGKITISTDEGKYLYPDDLILVGNIVFRVTAGPPDSDVLTVTVIRGTDAAIANGSVWRRISHSAQEGGVAREDTRKTVPETEDNYTQILKDWLVITGTMRVIPRYGIVSERAYQEWKLLKRLAIDLEYNILYGVKSYSAGPPRKSTMGGLFEYVFMDGVTNAWDTVRDLDGDDLDKTDIDEVLQEIWELGGQTDFIMVNGTNKRRISSWATPFIRTECAERTFGATVQLYESDFGIHQILLNRHLRPSDVIFGSSADMGLGPLTGRQFQSRMLPSTLDGEWFEILGEYTMEVHGPSVNFGWLYNTSTTI